MTKTPKLLTKAQLDKRISKRKAKIDTLRHKIAMLHRENAADYSRKLSAMDAKNIVKNIVDKVNRKD